MIAARVRGRRIWPAGSTAGRFAAAVGVVATVAMVSTVTAVALLSAVLSGCSYFAPRGRAPGPEMTPDGVRFRYYAPEAIRVQLAGDWPENNWAKGDGSVGEANVGLMTADADGMWEIVVPLPAGRYHYMFWVDENTWHLDPGNSDHVAGGPAGKTCLLVVFMRDGKLEIR